MAEGADAAKVIFARLSRSSNAEMHNDEQGVPYIAIGDLKVWTFGIRLWIWAEWWGEPGGGGAAGGGQVDLRDRTLWFCAEESGDPRTVAEFVQDFLKRFRPNDSFSIGHAFSCSRLRIDGIGGAIFVAPERIEYLDTFALDCGRGRREIR